MTEVDVLHRLAALVDEWRAAPDVLRAILELTADLAAGDEPFVGRPLPAALVDGRLPPSIASAWVFVLRASQRNPAHFHPNSTQYTTAIHGGGTALLGSVAIELLPFDRAHPAETIHVIPPLVPHSFATSAEGLVVLSFHSVAAELLEEVEVESSRSRRYL